MGLIKMTEVSEGSAPSTQTFLLVIQPEIPAGGSQSIAALRKIDISDIASLLNTLLMIGDLDELETEDNSSLVAAINEAAISGGGGGGEGGVISVNGKRGRVVLTASDVDALPTSYTPPVSSVDGKTGAVTILPTGGLVGQVLKKSSNDNYAVEWMTLVIPSASSATPQPTGTAAAGSSSDFARADHVHTRPTAAEVGAIPAPVNPVSGKILKYNGSAWAAEDNDAYVLPSGGMPATDMASAVQTTLQKANDAEPKTTVVNKSSSDISQTLEANTFYVWPEMASLAITCPVTGGPYAFRFTSGATATTLSLAGVIMPDDFEVEADRTYEINVFEGMGLAVSWEVSA